MWCGLLLLGFLATGAQAFHSAPIRWDGRLGKKLCLVPTAPLDGIATPQQVSLKRIFDSKVPYFTTNQDNTISCDDNDMQWCLEASGTEHGHAVRVNHCTSRPTQKWRWLPWGPIQLEGTNQCIHVNEKDGLTTVSVELSECASKGTDTWIFENTAPAPARSSLQCLSSLILSIGAALMVTTLFLGACMWRWGKEPGMVPLKMDQGGVWLTGSIAVRSNEITMKLPSAENLQSNDAGQQVSIQSPAAQTPAKPSSQTRSPRRGTEPNIAWRAITMQELRAHPSFIALPPAHLVKPTNAADIRLFRQDSRQWWACHLGRITTSACASCLGVYESQSATFLGVPPSLCGQGKALDAHMRLQSPVLSDLTLLHADELSNVEEDAEASADASAALRVWRPHASPSHPPFLLEYQPRRKGRGGALRIDSARSYHSVGQIRMAWGSAQEATSILAALNYLGARNATVEEAGLQPLEIFGAAERSKLPDGLPPIGASPDAIVRWPDGSVEPFEVKNHAPFTYNRQKREDAGAPPFEIRDPGPFDGIATWHIPQLYLHMLCLGERCNSALFMSCSSTRGANLFRLTRNEALMQLMLHFVVRFTNEHGCGQPPPGPDYFWETPDYKSLLDGIKRANLEDVELVARIPNREVQRGRYAPFFFS